MSEKRGRGVKRVWENAPASPFLLWHVRDGPNAKKCGREWDAAS